MIPWCWRRWIETKKFSENLRTMSGRCFLYRTQQILPQEMTWLQKTLVEIKGLLKLVRSQFCNIDHERSPNIISELFGEPCPQLHRSPGNIFCSHINAFKNEWCHSTAKRKSRYFFRGIILLEMIQPCWKQWIWIRHIYEVRTLQCLESLRSLIFLVQIKVPVILPWRSCCFMEHLLVSEKRFFS